jgi:hypothetical protein
MTKSIVVQCGLPARPMKILFLAGLDGDVDISVRTDLNRSDGPRVVSTVTIGFYAMKGGGRGPGWIVQAASGKRKSKITSSPESAMRVFIEQLEEDSNLLEDMRSSESKARRSDDRVPANGTFVSPSGLNVLAFTLKAVDPGEFGSCLRAVMGQACLALLKRASELSLHFNPVGDMQKVFEDALAEHVMRS